MECAILGIDCATNPKKRGVVVARFGQDSTVVDESFSDLSDSDIAELVMQIKAQNGRLLLAMDAPLGWPSAMGHELVSHIAGHPIAILANDLFRRQTDRFIKKTIGKQSLDVGADRIARTAHSALTLLDVIAKHFGANIPLAWESNFTGIATIEVYPAATLRVHGLRDSGYKKPSDRDARQEIISGLPSNLIITNHNTLLDNADALDAAICVLAATDFIRGTTYQPDDPDLARKEGWIWVKAKER